MRIHRVWRQRLMYALAALAVASGYSYFALAVGGCHLPVWQRLGGPDAFDWGPTLRLGVANVELRQHVTSRGWCPLTAGGESPTPPTLETLSPMSTLEPGVDHIGWKVAPGAAVEEVPNIVHFVYALKKGAPFGLLHYAAVLAAKRRIRPARILFHVGHEPQGHWWRKASEMVEVAQARDVRTVFGMPVRKIAHKADVVRLEALIKHGGIYLDMDVLALHPFDALRKMPQGTVLGFEGGDSGLCNAVMIGAPNAPFLRRWYLEYQRFSGQMWSEFSVKLPLLLARSFPDEVQMVPDRAFFYPHFDAASLSAMYLREDAALKAHFARKSTYTVHLWSSQSTAFASANAGYSPWLLNSTEFKRLQARRPSSFLALVQSVLAASE